MIIRRLFLGAALIVLMPVLAVSLYLLTKRHQMDTNPAYRLKEPMLISASKGEPYYMIPANTILHYQRGFAEGHQLYTIEVFAKGELTAERVSKDTPVESTWLYRIEAEDVEKILHDYPLSKDDLIRVLKARKMTRDELAQIVREWKEE